MTGATRGSQDGRQTSAPAAGAGVGSAGRDDGAVEEILRLAAAGDGDAWRRLVEGYSRRVYGLLVRQCGDRDLAEEITQSTFVKLVQKLADFEGYEERGRFEAWLFRVAMNGLRDEMRRRKRQAVGVGGEDQAGGHVHPGVAASHGPAWRVASQAEEVERLRDAVAELGDADREVLHLRHTLGMSFAEIAATLQQPLGTVLARAHRALGKLRKRMEEADGPKETGVTTRRGQPQPTGRGKASGR